MFTEDNYQRLLWNIATAGGATREAITKQQIEELFQQHSFLFKDFNQETDEL